MKIDEHQGKSNFNTKILTSIPFLGYLLRVPDQSWSWVVKTGTAVVSRDSPSRESWMKTQEVDIQAKKLYLKVFLWFWTCSERSRRMETGGSTQNFAARLVSIVVCPGEPFLKKMSKIKKFILFENMHVLKFQKCQFSRNKSPCGSSRSRLYLFRIYLEGGKRQKIKYWNFDFA